MTTDIVERLRARTFRPVADIVQRFNEQGNLTNGDAALHAEAAGAIEYLRAEALRLRAEVEALRKALDAIYNHDEAARAAVIQHYGLWHNTALKEHTNGRCLIERLRAAAPEGLTAAHVSDLAAAREAADEIERLRSAVLWALGYDQGEPEFTSRPDGAGAYWWRTELRRRAGIPK